MLPVWLERFALIGALSALILALIFPNFNFKSLFWINKAKSNLFVNKKAPSAQVSIRQGLMNLKDHPKYSGGVLNRMTSQKPAIDPVYKLFGGFGQTPIDRNPSFVDSSFAGPNFAQPSFAEPSFAGAARQAYPRPTQTNRPLTSLYFFTFTVFILLTYTSIKILTSWLDPSKKTFGPKRKERSGFKSDRTKKVRDLKQDKGERKFARLTREEKTRELMLHHGGKNVSSAIKFLVNELEKQKHLLFKNLSQEEDNAATCSCACHSNAVKSLDQDELLKTQSEIEQEKAEGRLIQSLTVKEAT